MIRVPKKTLFLCGWDDTYPPEVGPTFIAHHVASEDGRMYLNDPDFLRFEGADVISRFPPMNFTEQIASNPHCSMIDYRRYRIPIIEDGTLLLLPMDDESLPTSILDALEIPYLDVHRVKPDSVVRISYAHPTEACSLICRLYAYYYLLGWSRLLAGEQMAARDEFYCAAGGPWLHALLMEAHCCRLKGFPSAEEHFHGLIRNELDTSVTVTDMRAASEKLMEVERAEDRNRASAQEIARDLVEYFKRDSFKPDPPGTSNIDDAGTSLRSFFDRSG